MASTIERPMLRDYEVLRTLSEGAAAEVLLARSSRTQERVIVEVLRPELVPDHAVMDRFLDEARARRAFEHPSVLRRVDEGRTEDGRPYLCSEPVDVSLSTMLATGGALEKDQAMRMVVAICDALTFLHTRGHVHGNIKPGTIFFPAKGGPPKLLDSGLSLLRPGRTLQGPRSRVLVEPEYLSPERVQGKRATSASDVYAVGLLLFEALTAFPAFTAADPQEARKKHLEGAPPALPAQYWELQAILNRCLAKDPAERYPSAAALRSALMAQLEGTLPIVAGTDEADGSADATLPPRETQNILGSYELLDPLGEGGMGRVFLARHTKLGREVALKLLKPELANQHAQVQRFIQEARAVNRVHHEHIVEIFDVVDEVTATWQRRVYCVMELLRGQSLREVMEKHPVPLGRALRVSRQTAGALDAAHRAGIVHRDVKPDNIFLTDRAGRDFVKVLDFGVAKLRGERESDRYAAVDASADGRTTRPGMVVGTPAYMAPEQMSGKDVDHRADIFSLGVVMFRLLCGRPPFLATTFAELLKNILENDAPVLPYATPDGEPIPEDVRILVRACLQKDPRRRPQSMAEVGQVLDGALARLHETTGDWLPAPADALPPPQRPWLLSGAAVVMLVAAGVVFAFARPPQKRAAPPPQVIVAAPPSQPAGPPDVAQRDAQVLTVPASETRIEETPRPKAKAVKKLKKRPPVGRDGTLNPFED